MQCTQRVNRVKRKVRKINNRDADRSVNSAPVSYVEASAYGIADGPIRTR